MCICASVCACIVHTWLGSYSSSVNPVTMDGSGEVVVKDGPDCTGDNTFQVVPSAEWSTMSTVWYVRIPLRRGVGGVVITLGCFVITVNDWFFFTRCLPPLPLLGESVCLSQSILLGLSFDLSSVSSSIDPLYESVVLFFSKSVSDFLLRWWNFEVDLYFTSSATSTFWRKLLLVGCLSSGEIMFGSFTDWQLSSRDSFCCLPGVETLLLVMLSPPMSRGWEAWRGKGERAPLEVLPLLVVEGERDGVLCFCNNKMHGQVKINHVISRGIGVIKI